MVTISLDEYGEFEKNENKPLFIAGLIFDDFRGGKIGRITLEWAEQVKTDEKDR